MTRRRPRSPTLASLRAVIAEQEATIQELRTRLSVAESYMHARRQAARRRASA